MDIIIVWVQAIIIFIFGAVVGSFLNVLIFRLPRGRAITGRSACQHCKRRLAPIDLVPVLSFLFLLGKCRNCGKPISAQYIYVELAAGLLFALSFILIAPQSAGDWLYLGRVHFIIAVLITIFVIDLRHYVILDKIVFPSVFVLLALNLVYDLAFNAGLRGVMLHINSSSVMLNTNSLIAKNLSAFVANSLVISGIIGAAIPLLFFGGLYLLSKGRWIGFGDVKFSLFLGLATPFPLIFTNLALAFLIGTIVSILLLAAGTKKLKSQMPFGTFLAASTLIILLFGPQITSWYARIVGW